MYSLSRSEFTAGGLLLTLTGSGFHAGVRVYAGGLRAVVEHVNESEIRVLAPVEAAPGGLLAIRLVDGDRETLTKAIQIAPANATVSRAEAARSLPPLRTPPRGPRGPHSPGLLL
ncbi:MAG: IPT/TIG domain-containing protein [Acidobacteria bacterium]|nr:IPT/TIG domain-containing protein [Acidobacteriota bacterium]